MRAEFQATRITLQRPVGSVWDRAGLVRPLRLRLAFIAAFLSCMASLGLLALRASLIERADAAHTKAGISPRSTGAASKMLLLFRREVVMPRRLVSPACA